MRHKSQAVLRKIYSWLGSNQFFYVVLGVFVLQALWIAFSAVYPQAFDEDFHFGIIRAYSHYWLPFLGSQPTGADAYGAVSRDPSYLYHYLLSFPYRLSTHFLHQVSEQIIALRVINVGLFAAGLVLYRRLLRRVGISASAANISLFILAFIPVASQLAGQINYDNLLLPLTAGAMLLTCRVIDQLSRRRIEFSTVIELLAVSFFATMVKYEFAPIFLAIVLFVAVYGRRKLRGKLRLAVVESFRRWNQLGWRRYIPLILLVIAFGLFLQRDGVNVVRYHTFAPNCSQVISDQQCSAYTVWIHDYLSHQDVKNHIVHVNPNPINYGLQWLYWMWYRLFFAINGPYHNFANFPPLPLPAAGFAVLALSGLAASVVRSRQLFRANPRLAFLGVAVALYTLILMLEGYLKYLSTGVLELMNGRYLLPILLPAAAIGIQALRPLAAMLPKLRYVAAVVILICFLQGGGVMTFILRSDPSWDWNNRAVISANNGARDVLWPVIFKGPTTYSTPIWFFN